MFSPNPGDQDLGSLGLLKVRVDFDAKSKRMLRRLYIGSFAAWWQVRYAGYVLKDSKFSYFQRLRMIWKKLVGFKGYLILVKAVL
jgi:hypothetical protein